MPDVRLVRPTRALVGRCNREWLPRPQVDRPRARSHAGGALDRSNSILTIRTGWGGSAGVLDHGTGTYIRGATTARESKVAGRRSRAWRCSSTLSKQTARPQHSTIRSRPAFFMGLRSRRVPRYDRSCDRPHQLAEAIELADPGVPFPAAITSTWLERAPGLLIHCPSGGYVQAASVVILGLRTDLILQ